MYGMGGGPANPSTPGEGWENVEPSQSRAQPLQEVCSLVPRTLQLSQIVEGLVGGKEPVLGSITPGRAEKRAGEALGVYKASDPDGSPPATL